MKALYSIKEISDMYRLNRKVVLDMCHARGQRFALNPTGGKWRIDKERFDEYLERQQQKER